ncbi:MAG: radical SAM protein [Nanoarchaeota archaeon]
MNNNYIQFLSLVYSTSISIISKKFKIITPRPIINYLELTKECNLKCKSCSYWKKRVDNKLDKESIFQYVDELKKLGIKVVGITGGEPLLRNDLEDIIKYIKSKGIKVIIDTNGILLTEKRVRSLVESGTDSIMVSFYHSNEKIQDVFSGTKNTFSKKIKAIENLSKYKNKINFGVIVIITKENFKDIIKIGKFLKSKKVDYIKLYPMHNCYPYNEFGSINISLTSFRNKDFIKLKEKLQEFKKFAKNNRIHTNLSNTFTESIIRFLQGKINTYPCYAGYLYFYTNYKGDIFTCYDLNKPVGNVKKQKLMSIWRSKKFAQMRKMVDKLDCNGCCDTCNFGINLYANPIFMLKNFKNVISEIGKYL